MTQQRPSSYSPYGVRFEDEKMYKRQQQQKYKEDLDYLCSLRQKRNDKEKESIEEAKKIQMMNDVNINIILLEIQL